MKNAVRSCLTHVGAVAAMLAMIAACTTDESSPTPNTATADAATGDASPVADANATDAASDSTVEAAADTGTNEAGACAPLPAPTCNALAMPATAPVVTSEIGVPPDVSGGGVIPDGTYVLTREVRESGNVRVQKFVVTLAGSCVESYIVPSAGTEARGSGTVTYANDQTTTEIICPTIISAGTGTFRVDAPVGGKARYVSSSGVTPNRVYREWSAP